MKEGWADKPLGDACDVVNGGTPQTDIPEYWGGSNLWITPAEMGKRLSPYIDDTERKISDLGLRNSSARLLPPNSVILSSRAPIGYLVINTKPMATNQGCKGLIPGKQLEHKFLYYYLVGNVDLLNSLGNGATFKELSGGRLKEVRVPIPPVPEQQRIVGILDEALNGIAIAKANAEKNLQNARALFESHLNAVISQKGEGWETKKLGDLFDITSSKRVFEADWKRDGVPFYRAREIVKLAQQGYVENDLFISEEMFDRYSDKYGIPAEGDIMVTGVGTLGVCYVVQKSDRFYFKDGNIIWLKRRGETDSRFVEYAFKSDVLRKQIDDSAGATVGTYTIIRAKNTVIPVPSLSGQHDIVAKLDALSAKTRRMETIYQKKLAALDELKKSLLHQAFNGQL